MRRFPGSGPGLSAPPCRVLPSAVGLLSMNIQRPPPLPPLSSSSSSALYVSPWLRLFLRSGFLSLSLAHTYTHSLPRSSIASIFVHLRNHQELPTSRSGRGGLRTTNENKTRTERTTLYSFLLFSCCCFPPFPLHSTYFLTPTCERSPSKGWQRWVRQDLTWLRNKKARVVCVSSSWCASTLAVALGALNTCRVEFSAQPGPLCCVLSI